MTTGDPRVVIATVDTGVNADIPDLAGALAPGYDFVENDDDPQDTHGHGTLVASVLAARGDNGIGMAGYCWHCRVMPLRVAGTIGKADPGLVATAIRWAVDHGARVVNVSFAHPEPDEREEAAVRYAIDSGVIVVASAGNSGDEAAHYPAAYPGVLAAAGTDDSDVLFPWSTRGGWVRVSAPGCHVVIDYLGGQGTLCGTSFAPAAVAGIAGLILSRDPMIPAARVVEALLSSAKRPVHGLAGGRVDAWAAFAYLGWLRAPNRSGAAPWSVSPEPRRTRSFSAATILGHGSVRGRRTVGIAVGRGPLDLRFTTRNNASCSLTLKAGTRALVAPPPMRGTIVLSTYVASGGYTLEISCAPARRRTSYALELTAMFPLA